MYYSTKAFKTIIFILSNATLIFHVSITKTFTEICIDRACKIRDMDKEIEVYEYTMVMQYLREVCPKDQLYELDVNNPKPLTRVIVTPHHYNILFTFMDKRWKERIRYFYLTLGWDV